MHRFCDFLLNNIEYFIQITDYEKLHEECIKRKMLTTSTQTDLEELSSVAEKHRLLFAKVTHHSDLLKELLEIFRTHFSGAADFIKLNMKGVNVFCEPSNTLGDSQRFETDGAGMSTSTRTDGLQWFTDPVDNIRNIQVQMARTYLSSDIIDCYPMKSGNRVLFFVNNSKFKGESKFRKGADIDKANVINLYRQCGFKILYHENISLKIFHHLLDQLVQSNLLRSVECFVLCVLSHGAMKGNNQMIEFSCGKVGSVSDIVGKFNNFDCFDLRGRPKTFLFGMCRTTAEAVLFEEYNNRNRTRLERVKHAAKITQFSDIKIVYATIKGSEAYRDATHGTWFIKTFVEVIARHGHDHHFDDMMKIVGRGLESYCHERSIEQNDVFVQTIASEDIGFNKKLYFNPGL